jgi:ABC-type polysaccharide/polyol phosphate transport system ATPase subunit
MSDVRIDLQNVGKMYQVFKTPGDRLLYALGLSQLPIWRRRPCTDFWALRGVTLAVRSGERVGVIGRNGAGKSTMLKLAAGIISPSCGQVHVEGRVRALLELGIGFHPELTGRENVRAALAYGEGNDHEQELEDEIIKFSELHEAIDQPLKTFSSGMFTRLAFSVATTISPEVLIIDEILSTGDAYFAGKCHERIKRLSEESGAAVLMTSHDLGAIQSLCQRVIWVDRGEIKLEGSALEVLRAYGRHVRQDEEALLRSRDGGRSAQSVECAETYGLGGISVTGVKLNIKDLQDVRSLYSEEPFEVVVEWEAEQTIEDPVFVFCAYLPTGVCATQWIVSCSDLGYRGISGRGRMLFRSERLVLGKGCYVASVGIFASKPQRGIEPPAYHVLDRAVHFQVVNADPGDGVDHGLCRQSVVAELKRDDGVLT